MAGGAGSAVAGGVLMKQMAQAAPDGEALTEVAAPMRTHSKGVAAKGTSLKGI